MSAGLLFAFVLDVNETMSRRSRGDRSRGSGLSPLDWAKTAVEHIIKNRQRAGMKDHYLLLSTEASPACVKYTWGDPPQRFEEQLRMLTVTPGRQTSVSHGLATAFALLNQYRVQRGIDSYGQGRCPWMVEAGACVLFTDGEAFRGGPEGNTLEKGQKQLRMTCSPHPGAELTREPYRWDQRFFPIVLQSSAGAAAGSQSGISGPPIGVLRALAEATGGSYSSSDSLMGVLSKVDFVLYRLAHVGPVVIFQSDTSDQAGGQGLGPTTAALPGQAASANGVQVSAQASAVRGLLVLTNESQSASWPIPESYWLDRAQEHLPKRDAQPTLLYRRLPPDSDDPAVTSIPSLVANGVAADRYPIEWCGQSLKLPREARWPVYVWDSSRKQGTHGEAFGYLEAADVTGRVCLVLLPYNYPKLAELVKQAVEKGSALGNLTGLPVKWRPEFNLYLAHCPAYYNASLRKNLKRAGLANQVVETKRGGMGKNLVTKLQQMRDMARDENMRIETSRIEHTSKPPGLVGVEGQEGGPGSLEALGGGGNMLLMWEDARRELFGGRSLVLAGLYVRGVESVRGVCVGNREKERDQWPLLTEVGASLVPELPMGEVSLYMDRVMRTEVLRNPLSEPDPDEDDPEAMMRKKLLVNFGNPFKGHGGQDGRVKGGGEGQLPVLDKFPSRDEAEEEAAVLALGIEDEEKEEEGVMPQELSKQAQDVPQSTDAEEGQQPMNGVEAGLAEAMDGQSESMNGFGRANGVQASIGASSRKRRLDAPALPPLPFSRPLAKRQRRQLPSSTPTPASPTAPSNPDADIPLPTTPLILPTAAQPYGNSAQKESKGPVSGAMRATSLRAVEGARPPTPNTSAAEGGVHTAAEVLHNGSSSMNAPHGGRFKGLQPKHHPSAEQQLPLASVGAEVRGLAGPAMPRKSPAAATGPAPGGGGWEGGGGGPERAQAQLTIGADTGEVSELQAGKQSRLPSEAVASPRSQQLERVHDRTQQRTPQLAEQQGLRSAVQVGTLGGSAFSHVEQRGEASGGAKSPRQEAEGGGLPPEVKQQRQQEQQQQQAQAHAKAPKAAALMPVTAAKQPLPPLNQPNPEGWMLAFSNREKRHYWFNIRSKQSVWTSPPGLPPINEDTVVARATEKHGGQQQQQACIGGIKKVH